MLFPFLIGMLYCLPMFCMYRTQWTVRTLRVAHLIPKLTSVEFSFKLMYSGWCFWNGIAAESCKSIQFDLKKKSEQRKRRNVQTMRRQTVETQPWPTGNVSGVGSTHGLLPVTTTTLSLTELSPTTNYHMTTRQKVTFCTGRGLLGNLE